MLCSQCQELARGVCRFCGQGLCREHFRASRFVSGYVDQRLNWLAESQDYVIVENALWCGLCTVRIGRKD